MTATLPLAPPAVCWITRTLEDAGFETWAVGGAIRDALLGRPSGDWDLATRATPKEVRRIFRRTVPIGIEHGTVGVLARDGTMYEVTTFRRDVETDGRHAVVVFAETIEEDLGRRDFTINAMAWHALREVFCDPYGGAADLDDHVLRTVGRPDERFREDFLRILRALRFAGRFELKIERDTWHSLRGLVDRLPVLSPERVREELLKVLGQDPTPARSLELYAESGALAVVYPELDAVRSDGGWAQSLATVERLPPARPLTRLAALLRPLLEERAAALLVRMRLSNAVTDEVARLASASPLPAPQAPDAEFRRWLRHYGVSRLGRVARIELAEARARGHEASGAGGSRRPAPTEVVESWRRARAVLRTSPPLAVSDLAIDGRDLMRLGLKPGPGFGLILEGLLDWVLEDPSRNETAGLGARAIELATIVAEDGGREDSGDG